MRHPPPFACALHEASAASMAAWLLPEIGTSGSTAQAGHAASRPKAIMLQRSSRGIAPSDPGGGEPSPRAAANPQRGSWAIFNAYLLETR
jgi:hypothetical protein